MWKPAEAAATTLLQAALLNSEWLRGRTCPSAVFEFDFHRVNVCVMRDGGQRAFVKLSAPGRSIAAETQHHMLATRALRGVVTRPTEVSVPEILHADDAVLVTEFVGDDATKVVGDSKGMVIPARYGRLHMCATAVGSALAHLHGVSGQLSSIEPWAFGVLADPSSALAESNAAQRRLLQVLLRDTDIEVALGKAATEWSVDAFVHGDLRRSNLLGLGGNACVWLIDWESAGAGDRRWDLGCLLGELLMLAYGRFGDGRSLVSAVERLFGLLVKSYMQTTQSPIRNAHHIIAFASAWLLQQSWETLNESTGWRDPLVDPRFQIGRTLAKSIANQSE